MKKETVVILIGLLMSLGPLKASNIIFINGLSCVGKTTTANILQTMLDEPYIHMGMDVLLNLMPLDFIEFKNFTHEGFYFHQKQVDGKPRVNLTFGTYGKKLLYAVPQVVKALADAGNNVIIEIQLAPVDLWPYFVNALKDHVVFFVGLTAPLEVLEQRERERKNRLEGLARSNYDLIHTNKQYDLMIDTSQFSPTEVATQIYTAFIKNTPDAFAQYDK